VKIGIFAPELKYLGGGEKYIGTIAEILAIKDEVEILTLETTNKRTLARRLNINLGTRVEIKTIGRFGNIPILRTLSGSFIIPALSKKYDIFICQERWIVPRSRSKRSLVIREIPPSWRYFVFSRLISKIFSRYLDNMLKSYNMIIANSYFTKNCSDIYWDNKSIVLHPPVDIELTKQTVKRNAILTVGRFFVGGHNKKQLFLIETFKKLHDHFLQDWEFYLIGGVTNNRRDLGFVNRCIKETKGYPIHIHTNISYQQLKAHYRNSKIFWLATGFGEDKTTHPEKLEHFGISTVEAMASGCVPIVFGEGGQLEIVRHGTDGFLWKDPNELEHFTTKVANDTKLLQSMSDAAMERSKEFGLKNFEVSLKDILYSLI